MMGIRRHDRYVLSAFWASFGAILLFFTVIVVVIHLADRSGRFIDNAARLREAGWHPVLLVAAYYATFLPFIWLQMLPLVATLAAAFALTRLTRNNELAPLVASGVSTRRVTLPILLSGVVIAGALYVTQDVLVPLLSRHHLEYSRLLNDAEPDRVTKVPHFDDAGGARLSMAAYQPMARQMEGALLTFRDETGIAKEVHYYPLVGWNEERPGWTVLEDGTLFPVGEDRTGTVRTPVPAGTPVPLEAGVQLLEVSVLQDLSLGLSIRQTAALVEADPDNPRLLLMYHETFTRCLYPLVMLLLALPFCLVLGRRSALPGTGAALASGAMLYAGTFLAARMASSGELNPVVMAWLPIVVTGAVGFANWLTMRS